MLTMSSGVINYEKSRFLNLALQNQIWSFLGLGAKKEKNNGTFFPQYSKVEETKILSVFIIWEHRPPFSDGVPNHAIKCWLESWKI